MKRLKRLAAGESFDSVDCLKEEEVMKILAF
jgi:hypothetical protein